MQINLVEANQIKCTLHLQDCTVCYNDVMSAIDHCSNLAGDTNEIMACVESIIATSADCLVCICDVLGIIGGADISACDPAKIEEARRSKKFA